MRSQAKAAGLTVPSAHNQVKEQEVSERSQASNYRDERHQSPGGNMVCHHSLQRVTVGVLSAMKGS